MSKKKKTSSSWESALAADRKKRGTGSSNAEKAIFAYLDFTTLSTKVAVGAAKGAVKGAKRAMKKKRKR